jgi:hypothetical protein
VVVLTNWVLHGDCALSSESLHDLVVTSTLEFIEARYPDGP